MTPRERFQNLLRELFQFDLADLDFGIYRIMKLKGQAIMQWLERDLPKTIEDELKTGAMAEQDLAQRELQEMRRKVLETLGDDAIDTAGNVAERFVNTPVGQEYLKAQARADHTQTREALEAAVYNHLYAFFSRYWQDGDFISKRRYSKKERYAIPYNGEEVYLYWANHDQYYIKTAEHFIDYRWQTPSSMTVHFKLQAADVEQNNVKGAKRFFLPRLDGVTWSEELQILTIPFEYRPLTPKEEGKYGTTNQQERIIEEALTAIPERLQDNTTVMASLLAERRKDARGTPVSYLAHHLRQYTARNTRDFFIHKDVRGFLSRELDFYLKNEVLNLDELEAAGEDLAKGWFQLLRLIKRIGSRIIDFLAQIEDFQKALWEKKKFVTEVFYCITVGNIPEEFYPAIAANEGQWQEWRDLFRIDSLPKDLLSGDPNTQEGRIGFLKAHPSLVLDTRHFSQKFTDCLLARLERLNDRVDGVLINSENWQALNLLTEPYRDRVAHVHIDPPYNTQTSGFLYKNNYKHSSWLTMMENRLRIAWLLVRRDGSLACHIDENEYETLHNLFAHLGIPLAGTVIWDKQNPMLGRKGIATQHEYILWLSTKDFYVLPRNVRRILANAAEIIGKHGGVNEASRRAFAAWIRRAKGLSGGERAYNLLDDDGRVFQSASLEAPEQRTDPKFFIPLVHPVTRKNCPVPANGWSRSPETMHALLANNEILFGSDETVLPRRKVYLTDEYRRQLSSVIREAGRGKADLDDLGLQFPYAHPCSLYEELIGAGASDHNGVVLDFFAGSGTTGHAVINLNREDGGRRRFVLVEMDQCFDTVLLPRIKKVTFTPEWKDGEPKRMTTPEEFERGPRVVKVLRLEAYEDALNNIIFDEETGQKALDLFDEEYQLHYMLQWESRRSETLLDVEKLQSPFSYKLCIHCDGEIRQQAVDLPETFAYLVGLDVETRRVYHDGGRRYLVYRGAMHEGSKVAVIWRETKNWTSKDYQRDAAFVAEQKMAEGADEVFVNGDSYIPGARSLDGVFKARLFGQEG